jgi:hypothetical protein
MPPPRVTVYPATAEEWPVVERLAQLERHDLSQFRGYVPRADGTYAFDRLDLFRAEAGPGVLIRYGLTLAGFALTRPLESGATSMYAFFIVRGLRRHGVGLQAARALLRLIPACGASPSRTRTLMRGRSGSVSLPTLSVTDGTWRRWTDLKDTHPTSGSA